MSFKQPLQRKPFRPLPADKPLSKPWPPFADQILRDWYACPAAWGSRTIEIHLSSKARDFIQLERIPYGIPATFLPDGCELQDYFWPVDGQTVILLDYGNHLNETIQKMAVYLIYKLWAEQVVIHTPNNPVQIIQFTDRKTYSWTKKTA
jgi:hypothetical protein